MSSTEIALINIIDTKMPQRVINVHPFTVIGFVRTQVKCNKTLFFRENEQESHILVLATTGATKPFLLDIRVDALRAKSQQKTEIVHRALTCFNSHQLIECSVGIDD